jgi:hypothetical protein
VQYGYRLYDMSMETFDEHLNIAGSSNYIIIHTMLFAFLSEFFIGVVVYNYAEIHKSQDRGLHGD